MTWAPDSDHGTTRRQSRSGGRRAGAIVLLVGALALVLAVLLSNLITAPYVVFKPGHAYDVLSEAGPGDAPMISIDGHETHPTDGALRMTTISMYGGPGHEVSWWDLAGSWLGGDDEILPRRVVFPEEVTEQEVEDVSTAQMVGSQSGAATVALRAAGIEVAEEVVVAQVMPDAPAEGVLEVEDVILTVDGVKATALEAVQQAIQSVEPGDEVSMRVERGGSAKTVKVPTTELEGRTVVGVGLATMAESDVDVAVHAGAIGGPSAGMMLALGIYDKLTPGPLTGGEDIAGTGTISTDGRVGPIDGIPQKMDGAREAGATWFLAPDDNCEQVLGNVPDGMTHVAVTDFPEALAAVEAIAAGDTDDLETCEDVTAGR
ncbi:PDZ domain-containing protein [Kytococcus sedentarius]|uniref:YlbL family protein n=1 Tax=Kytococcus sedentarius TaxID=1276 RepID=UPI0035BC66F2